MSKTMNKSLATLQEYVYIAVMESLRETWDLVSPLSWEVKLLSTYSSEFWGLSCTWQGVERSQVVPGGPGEHLHRDWTQLCSFSSSGHKDCVIIGPFTRGSRNGFTEASGNYLNQVKYLLYPVKGKQSSNNLLALLWIAGAPPYWSLLWPCLIVTIEPVDRWEERKYCGWGGGRG